MPNIFVSWSTSDLRVGLVRCSKFNPFSTLLTDWSNAMLLLLILFVIFNCLCHTVISVGKGLISWLSCMWCFFVILLLSHMESSTGFGTWLNPFLIFAYSLTLRWTKADQVVQFKRKLTLASSYVTNFNIRNKFLTQKLLKQGFLY